MMDAQNTVLLVVTAIIVAELLKLGTQYFFKRVTRDDYITKDQCDRCSSRTSSSEVQRLEDKFDKCMGELRGILLVVAVKAGVPPDQLKDLTG